MARISPKLRLLGALTVPFLAAIGTLAASCSSTPDEESGALGKDVKQIVYVVRQTQVVGSDGSVDINVAGGMGQVMDYGRYMPGGRLELKDLVTGKVQNVIEGFATADVQSLDLSFDATKVVFSMKKDSNDDFHIYVADLKRGADGKFPIRQLTFGPNDDIYPVWVAGGKIAFVTNQAYTEMGTRADEYNHSRVVTQIATVTETGGDADRKLCSHNLSHTINLFAMQDGRIGFSRWEHLENINDVKLFAMNPDCSQMVAVGGQHGKPGNSLVQISETNTQNVFLGITTSRENTIQAGALIRMDARSASDPTRVYEEDPKFEVLTPGVPRGMDPSPVGRYRYPVSLPDGRILVSWASGFVNELNELSLTPPDFGLYLYNPSTRENQLVANYEGSWELYGRPVVKRAEPPIIASVTDTVDPTVAAVFGSVDVRNTSLFSVHGQRVSGAQFDATSMDDALAQTDKVRIIEGFSSEAAPGVTMFGLTMAEGAAVLGEADVYEDGSWLAAIPPYVPVHLQPIDKYGLSIRNQTTWIQGMPGEDRVCGGCHEDRGKPFNPGGQALTIAAGKGPQNFNQPIATRAEYPWYKANAGFEMNEVQALLDAKCVSCHNESTNGNGPQEFYTVSMADPLGGAATVYQIPRMDLSNRPITVTYDNMTNEYPASYVSIFYPGALEMEMDDATVTGTIPPIWAVNSSARQSALIEKLNAVSLYNAADTAWKLGEPFSDPNIKGGTRALHPENVGTTLTREERMILIRAIDLGGQYYARQNTAFAPYGSGTGNQY